MHRIGVSICLITPVVLGIGAPALAGPFDPSYKGAPNSVHVAFDWNTFNVPWTASELSTGATSYPLSTQGPDSLESGPDVAFICPNLIDDLPTKLIRIQMFFDGPIDVDLLDVQVVGHDPLGASASEVGRGGAAGPFSVYYIDFEIHPNPDWEEIFFYGNDAANIRPGNFLRLEVDTITIPAPMGLASFAALGALGLRRRR